MRWIGVLVAVTIVAGALRAGPALHPNPYVSADERSYTNVALRLAETGRYGRDSLHWPPGAPVAFAAAIRVGGVRAAYWVNWLAGTALVALVFFLAGGPPAGGAGGRGGRGPRWCSPGRGGAGAAGGRGGSPPPPRRWSRSRGTCCRSRSARCGRRRPSPRWNGSAGDAPRSSRAGQAS